ncbi:MULTISPECIES: nickel ABC transporter permease [unclassified Paenibacillus]|uniref:nickel ABC transporter permease n=1 Tax=unclassified Paenibacillus TaxID=185978 RepID=UPI000CFCC7AB|nr:MULTISPECIES: nickel ABC transporter permease [unclassified Paenibacillus]PRA07870.1 nickel ABC transporter permease subunit NikB [Paenibacillus sp. MYb63]PRA51514.1 nickel ABC transporter permease subunit NikB [Paenibacillus sp. MYb67]
MVRQSFSRIIQLILVLLMLSLATFLLLKLAPGDPVLTILKANEGAVSQSDQDQVQEQLGLNLPLVQQYGLWLQGVIQLDLGKSFVNNRAVWDLMMDRLPATVSLTSGAIVVLLLISVPLAILGAKYKGKWPDHLSRLFALIGASIPSFWLGLLLIYAFAFKLNWLPTMGSGNVRHLILPSITLGFVMAPEYIRLLRSGLLDALSQEYVRAARARGIAEWRVIARHALRAALLPVITIFGMSLGALLAGSVVTETLFAWPGLGSMVMEAITQRNYPVIQGYVLLTGVFIVTANVLVDLSYSLLDPRIRSGRGRNV